MSVSSLNDCHFCYASHRAAAAHHFDGDYELVDAVLTGLATWTPTEHDIYDAMGQRMAAQGYAARAGA